MANHLHDQPFPLFRLATLLARQLSSPIASRIKAYCKNHPKISKMICGRCANYYNDIEYKFKVLSLRLSGAKLAKSTQTAKLAPLSPERAIEIGGDILGEIVIFLLGATILIFELNRQGNNQLRKQEDERSRWIAIGLSLEELSKELVMQQKDIDRLHAALLTLQQNRSSAPEMAML